jgi:hypothetical protein
MEERQFGYEYFLVTEVPQHKDYMIRQIRANETFQTLRDERSRVIAIPRSFAKGLNPVQVGEKLILQYELEKERDSNRTLDLIELDRYFGVNGITLGELRELRRSEIIKGLAQVCLKEVPAGSKSAAEGN